MRRSAAVGRELAGARILVVEDEPIIALELQLILADEGAQVIGPFQTIADAASHARLGVERHRRDNPPPSHSRAALRAKPEAKITGPC